MTKHYHNRFGGTAGLGLERKDDNGGSPDALKKAISEVMTGFEELKSTNDARLKEIEKKGTADALFGEKLGRIEQSIAAHEAFGQRLAKAEAMQAELKALDERFDAIETMIKRRGGAGSEETKNRGADFIRAAAAAIALGQPNIPAEQQKLLNDIAAEYKALSVSNDSAGGFLAPTEYVREITKGITELSPVRSLVKIRSTGSKSMQIPRRTGQFAAQRVIEGGTKTETTGLAYGLDELMAPELFALVDITNDMLEDSAFNIEAEINGEATEQFAKAEGAEFVTGTGIGQLEGILVNASVTTQGTGSAAITADGLIQLKYGVKSGYMANGTWILNRTSIGQVRLLKDTTNQYLWQPGLAQGRPNTLDGDPYVEVPDMPNAAAAAKPVGYGDWSRAYTLLDRVTMEMLRDPYTQAGTGKVRYIYRKRVGGKMVLPEAVKLLVCS